MSKSLTANTVAERFVTEIRLKGVAQDTSNMKRFIKKFENRFNRLIFEVYVYDTVTQVERTYKRKFSKCGDPGMEYKRLDCTSTDGKYIGSMAYHTFNKGHYMKYINGKDSREGNF